MARIFDDITTATPENVYAGMPVQEVKALNAEMSSQYQQNKAAKDALDVMANNLDVEDRNYQIKKRVIDETKAGFKDLLDKGDYQNAKYLVTDTVKRLSMDNQLQASLKSQQNKKATIKELNERLEGFTEDVDDKGKVTRKPVDKISKDAYDYALNRIGRENTKEITYNPQTGKTENMFTSPTILADQSSAIAQETMTTIENWKATAMGTDKSSPLQLGDNSYVIHNIGGVEKVFKNGKEVEYNEVANALKQHIANQTKYTDYLNQQTEIQKYNMLTDPTTGQRRNFERGDLKYLNDEKIKDIKTGVSEEQLKNLEKSKNIRDLALAKQKREERNTIDVNDPNVLEEVHDRFTKENTLTKMVYPAAEKAAHQEFDYKLFTDHAALENLKAKHDRALKKYEYDLKNLGMPSNTNIGAVEKMTGSQYKTVTDNIKTYENDAAQKQAAFDAVKHLDPNDPLYQTAQKDLLLSKNVLTQAKMHRESFYEKITPEAKEKIKGRIEGMFVQNEHGLSNWDYRISKTGLNDLIKIAKENNDFGLVGRLTTAMSYLEKGEDVPPIFAKELSGKLTAKQYLPTLNELDSERLGRSAIIENRNVEKPGDSAYGESGFPSKTGIYSGLKSIYGATISNPAKVITKGIDNIMQNEYETNNNMISVKDIVAIPDAGYDDNTPAANKYHTTARTTFQNATDWVTPDGISYDKLVAQDFYHLNEKGEYETASVSPNKILVAPAVGSRDKSKIQVTFKGEKGEDLFVKDEDGNIQRAANYFTSGDPETTARIYNAASEYINASTPENKQQQYELKGEANFNPSLGQIILGQNSEEPITVFYPDGSPVQIKMVKKGEGKSKVVDAATGQDLFVNPRTGQTKVFEDMKTLKTAFQMDYEKSLTQ